MSEITKEVLEGLQGTFATKAEVETQLNAYKGDLGKFATSDDIQKLEKVKIWSSVTGESVWNSPVSMLVYGLELNVALAISTLLR